MSNIVFYNLLSVSPQLKTDQNLCYELIVCSNITSLYKIFQEVNIISNMSLFSLIVYRFSIEHFYFVLKSNKI